MTLRELLHNPPPGLLADHAAWLIDFGDRHGWDTPRPAEAPTPEPVAPSRRRLGTVAQAAQDQGRPDRTVRAHARDAEAKPYPPFYCDREGRNGSYRIDLDEYAQWLGSRVGDHDEAGAASDEVVDEIVTGLLRAP